MTRRLPITLILATAIPGPVLRFGPFCRDDRLPRCGGTPLKGCRTRRGAAVALIFCVVQLCLASTGLAQTRTLSPQLVPTLGHTNKIASVAYSEDGKLLITGAGDGVVVVWDVATSNEIRRYVAPAGVLQVQFLDNGRRFFAGYENGTARLWETASGTELRVFDGHVAVLAHDYLYGSPFAVSPDGQIVATADKGGNVQFWNATNGQMTGRIAANLGDIGHLRFAPSGLLILVAGRSGTSLLNRSSGKVLWTVKGDTGAVLFTRAEDYALTSGNDGVHIRKVKDGGITRTIPMPYADAVSLSGDGTMLLASSFSSGASFWNVAAAKKLWDLPDVFGSRKLISASGVAVAPDGRSFATAPIDRRMGSWDSKVIVFSAENFLPLKTLGGQTARLLAIGFDGHLPIVLGADATGGAYLWRGQGRAISLMDHIAPVISGALSADGKYVALGSLDNSGTVWRATGDERLHFAGHSQYVGSVAFSHDGKSAYSSGGPGFRWSLETGQRMARYGDYTFGDAVLKIVPTGNDAYLLTQAFGQTRVWTSDGKQQPLPNALKPSATSANPRASLPNISPDGRLVTIDCAGTSTEPSPSDLGFVTRCADTVRGVVRGVSKDGKWILSSQDSVAYLMEGTTLLSFDHGRDVDFMALSDDAELLLTASLQDNIVHLWKVRTRTELCRLILMNSGHWVLLDADGRFDTDDIEGMRGLSWIMPNDPIRPLPLEIFLKDFFTPNLLTRTFRGNLQAVAALRSPSTATPKVSFEKIEHDPLTGTFRLRLKVEANSAPAGLDAFDLHVFREGRLVARLPEGGGSLAPYVKDGVITISDIQTPSRPIASEVRFSAYAFNHDRIKGETAEMSTTARTKLAGHPTAYVITFGVNSFDDPSWNLGFAAADARAMSREVSGALDATGQFEKVVTLPLISDVQLAKGEMPATRENLRISLESLSGKGLDLKSDGATGVQVPRARPEDLVLIHIATHGYAGEDGVFYILPQDIGVGVGKELSARLKAASISSGDLSAWLAGIDAREVIVILDTCQSAAVTGPTFKPAPIGDRSFGQLVFNKKMRLLVSTQADAASFELKDLKHGLMTYALVKDGLKMNQADFAPVDKSTTFSEWLRYGLDEVGRRQSADRSNASTRPLPVSIETPRGTVEYAFSLDDAANAAQVPMVFDFGEPDGPVLAGIPFFDRSSAPHGKEATAELLAAMNVDDPIASAAALKRFIKTQRPGAATALAWAAMASNHIAASAAPDEIISATRLAIQHLALVGESRTAVALLTSVADELAKRQAYPEVQTEFRAMSVRIEGASQAPSTLDPAHSGESGIRGSRPIPTAP